jgi:anti-sigma regulatory factor (Ser/Thr protein kinase)
MKLPDAGEFCLVLTPTTSAPARASDAILHRFGILAEEIRRDLAAVVAELVGNAVERGPGRPITVVIGLGPDAIRGEVSDQGGSPVAAAPVSSPFEIPLAAERLQELAG